MSGAPATLDLRGAPADGMDLAPAAEHVAAGGLLAYPTETVYGFGGACTPSGVSALTSLKPRAAGKPFLVVAPSADTVAGLAWTDQARELAGIFWPGAVTLILGDPRGTFPAGIRSETGTVAVRVSPHPVVMALMAALGAPLTSTSANAPGSPPARSGAEALAAVSSLGGGPEVMVLDGGTLPESGPSTLVDCTGPEPRVLREGTVPVGRLRCALPHIQGPSHG